MRLIRSKPKFSKPGIASVIAVVAVSLLAGPTIAQSGGSAPAPEEALNTAAKVQKQVDKVFPREGPAEARTGPRRPRSRRTRVRTPGAIEGRRHSRNRQLHPEQRRQARAPGGAADGARLCGYTGPRAVLNAAVVEFIHTATLVHDDIIDDAELRRGQKAVHSRWGNDVTVLAGDFLYIKSMAMALTQDTLDVVRLLCDVTLRMIEGEIYQLTKNGVVDLTEDEHFEIIRRKTAYLFAGCAQIGGMLGEAGEARELELREYGFNLGIMFQLVDDLLDFTGEAETIGKPIGGDLREGKITLPIIHLLRTAAPKPKRSIRERGRGTRRHPRELGAAQGAAAEHRCIEYAYARAVDFGEAAKRHLSVSRQPRARGADGAGRLRPLSRPIARDPRHERAAAPRSYRADDPRRSHPAARTRSDVTKSCTTFTPHPRSPTPNSMR